METRIDLSAYVDPTARLFGERLKTLRLATGVTQGELADKTGTTASHISRIERGQANPTLDLMVKLAAEVGGEVWDMVRPHCGPAGATDPNQNG